MNKLKKTLNHRASDKFVNNLEAQLMEKFEKKHSPFFFLRLSAVGVSFALLIAMTAFFVQPLGGNDNLMARALDAQKLLLDEPGVFHMKYEIRTVLDGVEETSLNEFWIGDKQEHLSTHVVTSDPEWADFVTMKMYDDEGYYYQNYPDPLLVVSEGVELSACLLAREEVDGYIGFVQMDARSENGSKSYEPARWFMAYNKEDFLNVGEAIPSSYYWQMDGAINESDLAVAIESGDYEVEDSVLNGEDVYKISFEDSGGVNTLHFEKEGLKLKRSDYISHDGAFEMSMNYLAIENLDLGEDFFDPKEHGLERVMLGLPDPLNLELGCYKDNGKRMSAEEEKTLLEGMPNEIKEQVQNEKALLKRQLKNLEACEGNEECITEHSIPYSDQSL